MDVTWDAGGSNSYRMGAEGKFDLALAPSHDPEKLKQDQAAAKLEPPKSRLEAAKLKVCVKNVLKFNQFLCI